MEKFEYADEKINDGGIMIAVASMVIGVGVLALPKDLTVVTKFADGWVVILIGGAIVTFFTWLAARLATRFPHQSFMSYATLITAKPVSVVLTFLFSISYLCIASFQIRKIADISKHYLLNETPMEVIAFVFFLVVIYAVSGSSIGLLRLNMLFLPIIIFIALVIITFNITWFDIGNLLPVFKTSFSGYTKGLQASILGYGGFSIVLFYMALVKNPKKTAKKVAMGMVFPIGLYLLLFISVMSVYGHSVTKNLLYPTIELAKTVDIPGGLFERFESVFFVIWLMAIFNTTTMAFDLAVISMKSIFKNISKMKTIFILAPIIYFFSMFPNNLMEVNKFGTYLSNIIFLYDVSV